MTPLLHSSSSGAGHCLGVARLQQLHLERDQTMIPHRPDRDLTVAEAIPRGKKPDEFSLNRIVRSGRLRLFPSHTSIEFHGGADA
jgi:hypothetical protein